MNQHIAALRINLAATAALQRLPELLRTDRTLEHCLGYPECANVADLIYLAIGIAHERGDARTQRAMQALDTVSFRHRHGGYFLDN